MYTFSFLRRADRAWNSLPSVIKNVSEYNALEAAVKNV